MTSGFHKRLLLLSRQTVFPCTMSLVRTEKLSRTVSSGHWYGRRATPPTGPFRFPGRGQEGDPPFYSVETVPPQEDHRRKTREDFVWTKRKCTWESPSRTGLRPSPEGTTKHRVLDNTVPVSKTTLTGGSLVILRLRYCLSRTETRSLRRLSSQRKGPTVSWSVPVRHRSLHSWDRFLVTLPRESRL